MTDKYIIKMHDNCIEVLKMGMVDYDGIKARDLKVIITIYESGSRDWLGHWMSDYSNRTLEQKADYYLKRAENIIDCRKGA